MNTLVDFCGGKIQCTYKNESANVDEAVQGVMHQFPCGWSGSRPRVRTGKGKNAVRHTMHTARKMNGKNHTVMSPLSHIQTCMHTTSMLYHPTPPLLVKAVDLTSLYVTGPVWRRGTQRFTLVFTSFLPWWKWAKTLKLPEGCADGWTCGLGHRLGFVSSGGLPPSCLSGHGACLSISVQTGISYKCFVSVLCHHLFAPTFYCQWIDGLGCYIYSSTFVGNVLQYLCEMFMYILI